MQYDDPGKDLDVKPSKIVTFLQNRLFYVIAGLILLLAVGLSIFSLVIINNRNDVAEEPQTTDLTAMNDDVEGTAEVLPQQVRSNDDDDQDEERSWTAYEAPVDPFADPMRLTGVLYGGRGDPLAIIESSGTSYIVYEGDYVDDLWAVRSIVRDSVILRAHNQEVKLYFDQAPETRSLDSDRDLEEDDPEED